MQKPMLLTIILATLAAMPASAQQGMRPRREGPLKNNPQAAAEAAAAPWLMQLRTQRISQTLQMPEDQAKVIALRWSQFDRDFISRAGQMGQLRGHFHQILLGPGAEDDKNVKLKPLLEQFMELRRQQLDLKNRFEDDVRGGLSSAQQVRLILLVDDLQKTIREGIREAIKENRANRRF